MKIPFNKASLSSTGSAALVALATSGTLKAESFVNVGQDVVSIASTINYNSGQESTGSDLCVSVTPQKDRWTKEDGLRFKVLAKKRALGQSTETENQEFEALQAVRRSLENPPSTEQLIADIKRRKMLADLETFFKNHGAVFKQSNSAWFPAPRET